MLVIAHRDELLTQARDKLLLADPSAEVGIVRAEHDDANAQVVVASIQTLIRPGRLARVGGVSDKSPISTTIEDNVTQTGTKKTTWRSPRRGTRSA